MQSIPVSATDPSCADVNARLRKAYGEEVAAWLEQDDLSYSRQQLRGRQAQETASLAVAGAAGPHPEDTPAEAEFWKRLQQQREKAQRAAASFSEQYSSNAESRRCFI